MAYSIEENHEEEEEEEKEKNAERKKNGCIKHTFLLFSKTRFDHKRREGETNAQSKQMFVKEIK